MEQTTDGGIERRGFDVAQTPAVKKAEEVMAHAGDGVRAWLPETWLEPSLWGLQRWQWLAIPLLAGLVVVLTLVLEKATAALVRRVRKDKDSAERINARISWPLRLGWASLLARIALPALSLTEATDARWDAGFRVLLEVSILWGALRALNTWSEHFPSTLFAQTHPGSRALASLAAQIGRVALFCFAALLFLSELGYSVTSVLAGLGIGGIALALGAQKTLENVFGAFALAVDQPIREGDFIRVDDLLGTVEAIGLRSTRIRTLDRTTVSIPNGKLADMKLETFATRDRVRLATMLTLRADTTAAQLETVLDGFRAVLRAQPKLWSDSVSVQLAKLGLNGQEVDISAWIDTRAYDEFLVVRQDVLLKFVKVMDDAGTGLAFPTQTVMLERRPR